MKRQNADGNTFDQWLMGLSDDQLVTLLSLRPDVAVPPPLNVAVLCDRVRLRASIQRAMDEADYFVLSVVEAFSLAGAERAPIFPDAAWQIIRESGLAGGPDTALGFDERVLWLRQRGLLWGGQEVRLLPEVSGCVPWRVGRMPQLNAVVPVTDVAQRIAELSEAQRQVIDTLAHGNPVGSTRDAALDAPADRPIPQLISWGLLVRVNEQTVELPHHVGQWVRGDAMVDPHSLTAPPLSLPAAEASGAIAKRVDSTAAGEALEFLRDAASVIEGLGTTPAQGLRTGGVGVREVRRIAKQAGLTEERTGFVLEVLAEAGLVASAPDSSGSSLMWAPSDAVDGWLRADAAHRWSVVAQAWWAMPRRSWLIGLRDRDDKPASALSRELVSPGVVQDRHTVVGALADGHGTNAREVQAWLLWHRPRTSRRFGALAVRSILAEAQALGVVAQGSLSTTSVSTPGQMLLGGEDITALSSAMDKALPAPLDYVLVQADLTVVAPGPLEQSLQEQMVLVADVESAGAATVYRVTERSVLRALDAGMSAAGLHTLFSKRSRTPVPQALTYLIDDMARRHGRLRVGMATTFIRCDDPAMLSEVLASAVADELGLRALAPTVAVSQAPLSDLLDSLRSAGFNPAGEDVRGAIVDMRPRGVRFPERRREQPYPVSRFVAPSDEQLAGLVRNLREVGSTPAKTGSGASMTETMSTLQLAAMHRSRVTIGYVDAQGVAGLRSVEPLAVVGGQLEAFDPAAGLVRRYPVHRISSVNVHVD